MNDLLKGTGVKSVSCSPEPLWEFRNYRRSKNKSTELSNKPMKILFAFYLSFSLLFIAKSSCADCVEYTIIDHGDRVEAICVGEPLTEAQKKEQEKLKEDKLKSEAQKAENQITTPSTEE